MTAPAANFDPLVRYYRALEWVAFGSDLERARFDLLDRLADRKFILVLGEGDGRCLQRLLAAAPIARVHCVDASSAMLARAEVRIAGTPARERVTFECADAQQVALAPRAYDAAVTLFFLDCFVPDQAEWLVQRIAGALTPDAVWLFADFAEPPGWCARLRARIWLAVLYTFFRWQTGLRTRRLPPSESLIQQSGFHPTETRIRQWGLLRTVLFRRT